VDAHHHLWDLGRRPQPWLDEPEHRSIRRDFDLGDLRAAATRPLHGRRLTATVVVQCVHSVPETRELLQLADHEPLIGAVVGWLDLTDRDFGAALERLLAGPGGGRLRALRHGVQGETDPGWLQRPAVEAGLRTLAARGLGYDLLVRAHQLPGAVLLAERLPELRLVLDHAGKPPIAGGDPGELAAWEREIRRLAAHPQVMCKVSGLITEADHGRWTTDDLRPVVEVLLDAFGPGRLMFGSDWPVSVLAGGWSRWAEAAEELLSGLAPAELQAVLAGTATDFYRLGPA
jgi:predicted TIM-barrel fold metal-dependent hydrolase